MKFKTKNLKVVAASILLATTLTSCCIPAQASDSYETFPSVEPTETISVDSTQTIANETEEQTISETNIEDNFVVETVETSNPLLSSGIDLEHYEGAGSEILGNPGYMGFMFGFDNKYSLDTLRNITYEYTGVYYDNLTLSDVNYFQGFSTNYVTGLPQDKFNFYFAND